MFYQMFLVEYLFQCLLKGRMKKKSFKGTKKRKKILKLHSVNVRVLNFNLFSTVNKTRCNCVGFCLKP
jgi:hypothetical protein